ncbi:MAG TPA: amidohydrolase family protein, partial [Terriglobales bacterium]|nr:amidohydrolase family protein [Terriglobales bacterium]
QGLIRDLVAHHVAVTSTLPVFEASTINAPPNPRALGAMAPSQLESFLAARSGVTPEGNARTTALLKKEMEFERAFAQAGGLLLAGPDPTGNGGTIPGFGDWRELELLVQAGFSPLEAIKIASYNGAQYLGRLDRIGSIAAGKQADLVVVHGDPATRIEDIEKTEIVFKQGVGYDSGKLIESVRGQVGVH